MLQLQYLRDWKASGPFKVENKVAFILAKFIAKLP
jgi:hypothetical protein